MPKSTFVDYVVNDLLAEIEGVRARAMFGGYGIYQNDVVFAILVEDELYYKVDDSNRSDFESHHSEAFSYKTKGRKRVLMSYWKLPSEILENHEILIEWTEKAIRVAESAKTSSGEPKRLMKRRKRD